LDAKSVDDTDDKAVQKVLRDVAIARYAERSAHLKEQQAQGKHERGKFAVRQQMKVSVVFCQLNDFVLITKGEQIFNFIFVDLIIKFF